MQNSNQIIINHLMKSTGMSLPEAQQMVATIPQKLQQAGIPMNSLPPDKLLKIIEGTYKQVKSGKKFTPPPKPPGFQPGAQPPVQAAPSAQPNLVQQQALAQAYNK